MDNGYLDLMREEGASASEPTDSPVENSFQGQQVAGQEMGVDATAVKPDEVEGIPENNGYLDLLREDGEIRKNVVNYNVNEAADGDAGLKAEALRLSDDLNVPVQVIERDIDVFRKEKSKKKYDYDKMIGNNPLVAEWLEDKDNAIVGYDDIDKLLKLEDHSKLLDTKKNKDNKGFGAEMSHAIDTGAHQTWASFGLMAPAFNQGDPRAHAAAVSADYRKLALMRRQAPKYYDKFQDILAKEGGDVTKALKNTMSYLDDDRKEKLSTRMVEFQRGAIKTAAELLDVAWAYVQHPRSAMYQTGENLANMAPSWIGGAVGTASPVPLGGFFGTVMGGIGVEAASWMDQYLHERGYNLADEESAYKAFTNPKVMEEMRAQAIKKGLTNSVVEGVTTMFSGRFFGKSANKGVGAFLKAGAKEMAQEGVSEASGEFFSQAAARGEFKAESLVESLQEGMAGVMMGGFKGYSQHAIRSAKDNARLNDLRKTMPKDPVAAVGEVAKMREKSHIAIVTTSAMNDMADQLGSTTVSETAPKNVDKLIDKMTGDKVAYYQISEFEDFWVKKGKNPLDAARELMGKDFAKAYSEAKDMGGTIAIPNKAVLKAMTVSSDVSEMQRMGRLDPDSPSTNDAAQFYNDLPEVMSRLADEASKKPVSKDESKDVKNIVKTKLRDIGFTEDQADVQATLHGEFFNTMAARQGVSPTELFKDYDLQILKGDSTRPGALFQKKIKVPKDKLGFVSILRQELENMDFKKIPPAALLSRLKASQIIKNDEIASTGLEDYLEYTEDKKVTKDDILRFLDYNKVKINQIVLGDAVGDTGLYGDAAKVNWTESMDVSFGDFNGVSRDASIEIVKEDSLITKDSPSIIAKALRAISTRRASSEFLGIPDFKTTENSTWDERLEHSKLVSDKIKEISNDPESNGGVEGLIASGELDRASYEVALEGQLKMFYDQAVDDHEGYYAVKSSIEKQNGLKVWGYPNRGGDDYKLDGKMIWFYSTTHSLGNGRPGTQDQIKYNGKPFTGSIDEAKVLVIHNEIMEGAIVLNENTDVDQQSEYMNIFSREDVRFMEPEFRHGPLDMSHTWRTEIDNEANLLLENGVIEQTVNDMNDETGKVMSQEEINEMSLEMATESLEGKYLAGELGDVSYFQEIFIPGLGEFFEIRGSYFSPRDEVDVTSEGFVEVFKKESKFSGEPELVGFGVKLYNASSPVEFHKEVLKSLEEEGFLKVARPRGVTTARQEAAKVDKPTGSAYWRQFTLKGGETGPLKNYKELLYEIPNLDYHNRTHHREHKSIFVHSRTSDIFNRDESGDLSKELHFHEIQGDAPQAGREKGYRTKEQERNLADARLSRDSIIDAIEENDEKSAELKMDSERKASDLFSEDNKDLKKKVEEIQKEYDDIGLLIQTVQNSRLEGRNDAITEFNTRRRETSNAWLNFRRGQVDDLNNMLIESGIFKENINTPPSMRDRFRESSEKEKLEKIKKADKLVSEYYKDIKNKPFDPPASGPASLNGKALTMGDFLSDFPRVKPDLFPTTLREHLAVIRYGQVSNDTVARVINEGQLLNAKGLEELELYNELLELEGTKNHILTEKMWRKSQELYFGGGDKDGSDYAIGGGESPRYKDNSYYIGLGEIFLRRLDFLDDKFTSRDSYDFTHEELASILGKEEQVKFEKESSEEIGRSVTKRVAIKERLDLAKEPLEDMTDKIYDEAVRLRATEDAILKNEKRELKAQLESKMSTIKTLGRMSPDMPFKDVKAWSLFLMKRAIQIAVNNGYDEVSWSPASVHYADNRWSTNSIAWDKSADGQFWIVRTAEVQTGGSTGREVIPVTLSDDALRSEISRILDKSPLGSGYGPRQLNSWAGQVYDGITSQEEGNFNPRQEGFINFYDKILPSVVHKYINKIDKKASVFKYDMKFDDIPYAEFSTNQGFKFKITDKLRKAVDDGLPLFQEQEGKPIGQFFKDAQGRSTIEMLEGMNRSTFLHETGHFFYQVLENMARLDDAAPDIKEMHQTVREFVGAEEVELTREQQEKFAEGFERYLREGKAPSAKLRRAFKAFWSWLKSIYTKTKDLKVELTPEIRNVFERMLAVDEELLNVDKELSREPLFAEPENMGMTREQATKYRKLEEAYKNRSLTKLSSKILKDESVSQTADYVRDFAEAKGRIDLSLDDHPVYKAIKFMTGKPDPNVPSLFVGSRQMNREWLVEVHGEAFVAEKLDRHGVTLSEGGVNPQLLADILGFPSPEDFIDKISSVMPREDYIENAAKREMLELYPDAIVTGEIKALAKEAVHNDERSRFLRAELEHLGSKEFLDSLNKLDDIISEERKDEFVSNDDRKELVAYRKLLEEKKTEIKEEIENDNTHKAIAAIKKNGKIKRKSLEREYGKDFVDQMLKPHGIVASSGGKGLFESAKDTPYKDAYTMIKDIASTEKKEVVIERVARERTIESIKDEDILARVKDTIEKLKNNSVHEKMMRGRIKDLAENDLPALKNLIRKMSRRIPRDAETKQHAKKIVDEIPVNKLTPYNYERAEARSAKKAVELFLKGDFEGAFQAKLDELLNHEIYKEVAAKRAFVEKTLKDFKKIDKIGKNPEKKYDMDLVYTAKAFLARYGLDPYKAKVDDHLSLLKVYQPETHEFITDLMGPAPEVPDYKQLPFSEFEEMAGAFEAIFNLARSAKRVNVGNESIALEFAVQELVEVNSQIKKGKNLKGFNQTLTDLDKAGMEGLDFTSSLKRYENFIDIMDKGEITGAYRTYLFNPVKEATVEYRLQREVYLKRFHDLMQKYKDSGSLTFDLIKGLPGELGAEGFDFKNGKVGLIGALLHTGNRSNMEKLLVGRKWGRINADTKELNRSGWDKFINRMYSEEIIGPNDMEFVQGVWDLLESLKPQVQLAHKAQFGKFFSEITADAIVTPWGETYKGGYFPAKTDYTLVEDAAIQRQQEALSQGNSSSLLPGGGPSISKGATVQRVQQYYKALSLDLNLANTHIDWALRFSIINPAVRQVSKIATNKTFRESLKRVDANAGQTIIIPALERALSQTATQPERNSFDRFLSRMAATARSRVSKGIMYFHAIDAIQSSSGISVAALQVKPKILLKATADYMSKNVDVTKEWIANKSKFMKSRNHNKMFDIGKKVQALKLEPGWGDKSKEWFDQHGYIFASAFQNTLDDIVWTGSYRQAIAEGRTETQAIRTADRDVRLTQGSFDAEDISTFEAGSAWKKFFTMFYSYWNTMGNLAISESTKIFRDVGLKDGMGRYFYMYMTIAMIPGIISGLVARLGTGRFDLDKDDEWIDEWIDMAALSPFKMATSFVPVLGPVADNIGAHFDSNYFNNRLRTSAVQGKLEQAAGAIPAWGKVIEDKELNKKAITSVITIINLITPYQIEVLNKPIGYLWDVATDKEKVADGWMAPLDLVRGTVTGKSREKK